MCSACTPPTPSAELKAFEVNLTLIIWSSSKEEAERGLVEKLQPLKVEGLTTLRNPFEETR